MRTRFSTPARKAFSLLSALLIAALAFAYPAAPAARALALAESAPAGAMNVLSHEGYTLEQVVVLSRHNIRSPYGDGGLTPHTWFGWTSKTGELSIRGGALEVMMGRFFRLWLEKEGLFPENYRPEEGEVRVYANSAQRTAATARYFTVSLFPSGDVKTELHQKIGRDDPVFVPRITFVSRSYIKAAEAQALELFSNRVRNLEDNYALLSDVIDVEQSKAGIRGNFKGFRTDDTSVVLRKNASPSLKGSLQKALLVTDALILQYYEEPDPVKAAFGHEITFEDWVRIGEIKDVYGDVLYGTPLIAVNAAHPLLEEIEGELTAEGRRFTFLCGHDTSITSVLGALGVDDYVLPGAIENRAPVGGKLLFCRWSDADENKWFTADLVYQTAEQIRSMALPELDNPPAAVQLRFSALETNADGLYAAKDFLALLDQSLTAYDDLKRTYSDVS